MSEEPSIEEYEGYLYKLKRNPPTIGSSWNKRFFRINSKSKTLEYFDSAPKGEDEPKDKRSIKLDKIVDTRSIDPWTFQIEVKEEVSSRNVANSKDLSKQSSTLQSGNMSYYCLQAKNQEDHLKWKSILENYVMDMMVSLTWLNISVSLFQ